MNLTIKGPKMGMTPAIREHATKQVDKLTRVHDGIESVQVVMRVERQKAGETAQKALMIARLQQGGKITGMCASPDLYQSLDQVADVMHGQLVRRIETRAKPARAKPARRIFAELQMH